MQYARNCNTTENIDKKKDYGIFAFDATLMGITHHV